MLPYYGGPNHDFSLNSHLPAHTHDGRRVSTLAPTEGLEPSDPNGQRFSRPLRYQLRYKSAYGNGFKVSAPTTHLRTPYVVSFGGKRRDRTYDIVINSHALYLLS